jgi:hypothetical protein
MPDIEQIAAKRKQKKLSIAQKEEIAPYNFLFTGISGGSWVKRKHHYIFCLLQKRPGKEGRLQPILVARLDP